MPAPSLERALALLPLCRQPAPASAAGSTPRSRAREGQGRTTCNRYGESLCRNHRQNIDVLPNRRCACAHARDCPFHRAQLPVLVLGRKPYSDKLDLQFAKMYTWAMLRDILADEGDAQEFGKELMPAGSAVSRKSIITDVKRLVEGYFKGDDGTGQPQCTSRARPTRRARALRARTHGTHRATRMSTSHVYTPACARRVPPPPLLPLRPPPWARGRDHPPLACLPVRGLTCVYSSSRAFLSLPPGPGRHRGTHVHSPPVEQRCKRPPHVHARAHVTLPRGVLIMSTSGTYGATRARARTSLPYACTRTCACHFHC